MKVKVLFGLLLFMVVATVPAMADGVTTFDPLGTPLYATGGDVVAYFVGSDASFSSTASLYLPTYSGEIFPNHSTLPGSFVNLGSFAPGTPLVFRLQVNDGQYNWFTGPATDNSDGIVHARTGTWVGTTIPDGTFVGFEDFPGGGDLDYNDHQFVFTNVQAVPEPGTMALFGGGLAGLLFRRRK
jgi:PEP-CTERM motif